MAFFEVFGKYMFFEKKSFILLCVNFDTLYTLYTINMAKCENLLFLLPLAVRVVVGFQIIIQVRVMVSAPWVKVKINACH